MKFFLFAVVWVHLVLISHGQEFLADLEQRHGGKLGVFAIDTETGRELGTHQQERFPLCSTFKLMAAAAILKKSEKVDGLLERRIHFTSDDLVSYSPVTEKHIADGMTVRELCAAALQYSDNTAGNLLIRELGGPAAVTAFAKSIGNRSFRLDRWETELNTAIPEDPRDTVTPADMAQSLKSLTLGDLLSSASRQQLIDWLKGNTTGAKRIRAAVPKGWGVGDKTGSGAYGAANDIAVIWPPDRKPIVIAIYHRQAQQDAEWNNEVIAQAAELVLAEFLKAPVKVGE
ncbi:class A beta-lactamase [Luteolibacter pohnpeiensis]|uniref:Beta-lactamase n=1 Tax=Luteolibacter pohnpeiensis TaxID=454153 RepID=A0A934VRE6_9BACT|nr:class A beta-lactamase [Luteolibacter pohnpeiensis]MBK1883116.1 class A beta-lactamase [Luteolibacter pohnpeiensis]